MIFTGLPEMIRAIRRRLGDNQTQFAARIGTKQNTVSQYESGKLEPGKAVLLNLQRLAVTDEEKQAFAVWLGADDPPDPAEERDNIVFQIRQAAKLGVATFAGEIGVGQFDVAAYESGEEVPPPKVVKRLQRIATNAGRADLALILSSDDWKVKAIFHPGETFISTTNRGVERPMKRADNNENRLTEREQAHALLDKIYDSGEEDAIVAVYHNLVVFGNYVGARRKSPGKKRAAKPA
jgi:DNA-binding transcriptional regulator YiaG